MKVVHGSVKILSFFIQFTVYRTNGNEKLTSTGTNSVVKLKEESQRRDGKETVY
jgi:hypothetical protein